MLQSHTNTYSYTYKGVDSTHSTGCLYIMYIEPTSFVNMCVIVKLFVYYSSADRSSKIWDCSSQQQTYTCVFFHLCVCRWHLASYHSTSTFSLYQDSCFAFENTKITQPKTTGRTKKKKNKHRKRTSQTRHHTVLFVLIYIFIYIFVDVD